MSAFDITWRDGAYSVSIPNYSGGKVYPAETIESLVKALERARRDIFNDIVLKEIDAALSLAKGEGHGS